MNLKIGDNIKVISGKDKGKSGKVMRIYTKQNRITVEKINMRTKHIKKTSEKPGSKIVYEGPISASNVMLVCPRCGKPARVGYKILTTGKKERICKKCKETVDTKVTSKTKK